MLCKFTLNFPNSKPFLKKTYPQTIYVFVPYYKKEGISKVPKGTSETPSNAAYCLIRLIYLQASTDSLISWNVASMSLSRPMLKRIRPSLIPISFWMSSGTSLLVLFPLFEKRVLK